MSSPSLLKFIIRQDYERTAASYSGAFSRSSTILRELLRSMYILRIDEALDGGNSRGFKSA